MTSKTFVFIGALACVSCVHAQTTVTAEMVKPVIEAANKTFTEFAAAIRSTRLPGLPLPTLTNADRQLSSVSQLLWRQLSNVDAVASAANKASVLTSLEAMCSVRSWLLENRSYANLLFAARIEETVCFSALSALAENLVTVDEARSLLLHLDRSIQLNQIVEVLEAAAPNSKAVAHFKNEGMKSTVLDLSERLAEESPELIDTRIAKLIEQERLASLVSYVADTATARQFSNVLVEFASKGGRLDQPQNELIGQIKELSPEATGKTDLSTGMRINAAMLASMMDTVRKWKAKQQTKP